MSKGIINLYYIIKGKIYAFYVKIQFKLWLIKNHCKDIYDWSNYNIVDMIDNKKISISKIAKMVGCLWDAVKKRYKKLKNNIDK